MKLGPQMALAVGVGYVLGRHRKLQTALILGGAAAVGRLSRNPGQLLAHGTRALGGSPELRKVAELGAPLVAASKDAARTAVNNRIDAMSGRLQDRGEALRRPGRGDTDAEERERERAAAPEEPAEEEEYEADEDAEYDEEPPPPPRPSRTRAAGAPVHRRGR